MLDVYLVPGIFLALCFFAFQFIHKKYSNKIVKKNIFLTCFLRTVRNWGIQMVAIVEQYKGPNTTTDDNGNAMLQSYLSKVYKGKIS